jgi:hypothetical protein
MGGQLSSRRDSFGIEGIGEDDNDGDIGTRGHSSQGGSAAVLRSAISDEGTPRSRRRQFGSAVFIGLPGNPQAAPADTNEFMRPLLTRMTGEAPFVSEAS